MTLAREYHQNRRDRSESASVSSGDDEDEHLQHGDDAPCIQVRRLLSGFPHRIRSNRWFVTLQVLQVGLDESGYGQSGADEAFVLAGYIGPVTHVEAFTHLWEKVLNKPPAMTVHELKKRIRWLKKIDERALILAAVVNACHLRGIRLKVKDFDYKAMNKALSPLARNARDARHFEEANPYFFAFAYLLPRLAFAFWKNPDVEFEVIYDENYRERKRLEEGYRFFRQVVGSHFPELLSKFPMDPIPRPDEKFSLLQAADALAWHSHRAHVENANGRIYENKLFDVLNAIPFEIDHTIDGKDMREAGEETARMILNKRKG
jgi:hypothetical protein